MNTVGDEALSARAGNPVVRMRVSAHLEFETLLQCARGPASLGERGWNCKHVAIELSTHTYPSSTAFAICARAQRICSHDQTWDET